MSKHRLLLADDSTTIQKVVNLTFADEGIEVVAVGDGDAAMQKFVEFVPDLVMVDVNMPGADGYRICEMIKQDEETRHIPVILLVGSFEPFDEAEARRVGADDFLTKPFQSIRQLVNKVSELLNDRRTADSESEAVNSFKDTLELPAPAEELPAPAETPAESSDGSAISDFGDAAMDDDLIQTSQIGSLPPDEAAKFESPLNYQPLTETVEDDGANEFDSKNDEFPPRHENIHEFADEQERTDDENRRRNFEVGAPAENFVEEDESPENILEESPLDRIVQNDSSLTNEAFPVLPLDDFDLLELPQNKKNGQEEPAETLSAAPNAVDSVSSSAGNLSPEAVEAVAERVIEKLSDEKIEKIVREVLSQISRTD